MHQLWQDHYLYLYFAHMFYYLFVLLPYINLHVFTKFVNCLQIMNSLQQYKVTKDIKKGNFHNYVWVRISSHDTCVLKQVT